jgi:hypothetical protein
MEASRLLDRELPMVLAWIDRVRSGIDPTTLGAADAQARALEREKIVRSARVTGLGRVAEAQTLMESIAPGVSAGNPMTEVINPGYAPYYLLGLKRKDVPKNSYGETLYFDSFDPFTYQWPLPSPFRSDAATVRARLVAWVGLAQNLVNREQQRAMNPDIQQLFNDAATQSLTGQSPYTSLIRISEFLLKQTPKSFVIGSYRTLYGDTISRLLQIAAEVRGALEITNKDDPSPRRLTEEELAKLRESLSKIHRTADLDFGSVVLSNRVERAIRVALNEALLDNSSPIELSTRVRLLASNDVMDELARVSGTTDLQTLERDLENSQLAIEKTLRGFGEVFGRSLSQILMELKKDGADVPLPAVTRAGKSAAELCLKVAGITPWPKDLPFELCDGRKLQSVFKGGPASLEVNRNLISRPIEVRACAYRDWLRANRIRQSFLERQSLDQK